MKALMRIGYPCINRSLACRTDQTFRLASYTPERFRATVQANLTGLRQVLDYNKQHGFLFFRISSETIPFASHPVCQIDWAKDFQKDLREIGQFILQENMRISMHPDQFVLINAVDPKIVDRSVADLRWHARFLNALGLGTDAKIQIHVGGVYGDKPAAIQRFTINYEKLPKDVKERLVIENDERLYDLEDCLEIHRSTDIPILFDSFHHRCLNRGQSLKQGIALAAKTWKKKDGCLLMDYSSQKSAARFGAHTDHLDENDFVQFLQAAQGTELDIMLEIKDKEQSALRALALAQKMKL